MPSCPLAISTGHSLKKEWVILKMGGGVGDGVTIPIRNSDSWRDGSGRSYGGSRHRDEHRVQVMGRPGQY